MKIWHYMEKYKASFGADKNVCLDNNLKSDTLQGNNIILSHLGH